VRSLHAHYKCLPYANTVLTDVDWRRDDATAYKSTKRQLHITSVAVFLASARLFELLVNELMSACSSRRFEQTSSSLNQAPSESVVASIWDYACNRSIWLSFYLSVCLSVYVPLSLCLPIRPFVLPSARPSFYPSARLSVNCPSVRPSVCLQDDSGRRLIVFGGDSFITAFWCNAGYLFSVAFRNVVYCERWYPDSTGTGTGHVNCCQSVLCLVDQVCRVEGRDFCLASILNVSTLCG
jgi:hypothetical protein